MLKIVLIEENGTIDSYAAGDPTPGRGANEFATREAAEAAVTELGDPGDGRTWDIREQ